MGEGHSLSGSISTMSDSTLADSFNASQHPPLNPVLPALLGDQAYEGLRITTPTPAPRRQGLTDTPLGLNSMSFPQTPVQNVQTPNQVLSAATAEQLYQYSMAYRQLYSTHQQLLQEHTTLKMTAQAYENLIIKSKQTDVISTPAPAENQVHFRDLPPYTPDKIDSIQLRQDLDTAHRTDPSRPSLRQLYWLEAYFEKPAKGSSSKKKKAAANPSEPTQRTVRGATRLNNGENVSFRCLVRLDAISIDGFELSDLFDTFENTMDWYAVRGLWADTPEGFKAMPDVLRDMDMRMRSHSEVFAYCSNSWKFLYMLSYKFPGYYTADTAVARRRRDLVAQGRANRMLAGETAYYLKAKSEDDEEASVNLPVKRRKTTPAASDQRAVVSSDTIQPTPVSEVPVLPVISHTLVPSTRSSTATSPAPGLPTLSPAHAAIDTYDEIDSIEDLYAEPYGAVAAASTQSASTTGNSQAADGMEIDVPTESVPQVSLTSSPSAVLKSVHSEVVRLTGFPISESNLGAAPIHPSPSADQTGVDPATTKAEQRKKASGRFASLKPATANTYAFAPPKQASIVTAQAKSAPSPSRSGDPRNTSSTSTPIRETSSDLGVSNSASGVQAVQASTVTATRSPEYMRAMAEAGAFGGATVPDGRKGKNRAGAPVRRRKWVPGNGTDMVPVCGRDWLRWEENSEQEVPPTLDDFWKFLMTQYQGVVDRWYRYCLAKEAHISTLSAAEGHAVKAEALSQLEGAAP